MALGDAVVEGTEFFDVVLGATTGGLALGTPSRARVWIVDEEQSLQFSASTYAVVEGGDGHHHGDPDRSSGGDGQRQRRARGHGGGGPGVRARTTWSRPHWS